MDGLDLASASRESAEIRPSGAASPDLGGFGRDPVEIRVLLPVLAFLGSGFLCRGPDFRPRRTPWLL